MSSYLEDLANVSISRTSRSVSRAGYGVALIAAYHALWNDRVRAYADLDEMVAAGFLTVDPAYRDAAALFAQDPAPTSVKIGRRANAYTQTVNITPAAAPAVGDVATVKVDGLSCSFTATATTVANVCTGLAASINAQCAADVDAIIATGASSGSLQTLTGTSLDGVVGRTAMSPARRLTLTLSSHADWDSTTATISGTDPDGNAISETFAIPNGGNATVTGSKRFRTVTSVAIPAQSGTSGTFTVGTRALLTASGTSGTHVACTATAGELHSYELVTAGLLLEDVTEDPGLAADLNAIFAEDSDWYGLLLDSQSEAEVATASTGAAAWTEAHKRLLLVQTADSAVTDAESTDDIGYVLSAAGYLRTAWAYQPVLGGERLFAAWVGKEFPKDPGRSVWGLKTLAGISAYTLTDDQRAAIDAKHGNHYLSVGGVSLTGKGVVAGNEWLDVVRDLDWLETTMKEDVFEVLVTNEKIEFTDRGIALVLTAVNGRLAVAVEATVLAADPAPTATAPRASATSTSDRQARRLTGVRFTGRMAGSIQEIVVNGRVAA